MDGGPTFCEGPLRQNVGPFANGEKQSLSWDGSGDVHTLYGILTFHQAGDMFLITGHPNSKFKSKQFFKDIPFNPADN